MLPRMSYPNRPAPQPPYDWPPRVSSGSPAPAGGGRARWYVAAALLVALAAGATLWLTVFKPDADTGDPPATASDQQSVARTFIEAQRSHDPAAAKLVLCKQDLARMAQDPASVELPATVTVVSYTITGQHDVPGSDSLGTVTIIDGSVTVKDGNNSSTKPIDLVVVKEDGAFKVCTSVARRTGQ
jgi:hypothetical protein